MEYTDFVETCGYGDVQGIGGANCRHSFRAFVEGVMERSYTDEQLENIDPPPFEFEGKMYTAYQATQKQREIERAVRLNKRRKVAWQAAGNMTRAKNAGVRLQRLNEKYEAFSKAGGLRMQHERMAVLYYAA